jgi:rhodanese-related sulfurtransferase
MSPLIIDTREEVEFAEGHVDGAINIPPAEFMTGKLPAQLADLPKDADIILYCRSGSRSNLVGYMLQQFGFSNLTNGVNQGHVEKLLASR